MKRLTGLFLLTLFLTFASTVWAQTPTRPRTSTPSSTTGVRDKVATQVAEIKSRSQFLTGKIASITGTSLVITQTSGQTVTLETTSTTKFIDLTLTKKTITLANLKKGDDVAAVGLAPTDRVGTAKLIAKIPVRVSRTTLVGTITNVQIATGSAALKNPSATVTLRVKTGTSSAVLVNNSAKLKIQGSDTPTLTDLKVGQRALVTGAKGTPLTATNFFVIGQNPQVTPTPTKVSTRSATPTPRSQTTP